MILKVPVTATSMPEWVRRAANAINDLINSISSSLAALGARIDAIEAFDATVTTDLAALDGRVDALVAFAAVPFAVNSVTFNPVTLPGTPVKGMTVYDTADDKLKCWNGSAWQALY